MTDFEDRRYYQNEIAMSGLDAWITREPECQEDPDPPEPCCPNFTEACIGLGSQASAEHERCDQCNGCLDCALVWRRQQMTAAIMAPPVARPTHLDDDEEAPF